METPKEKEKILGRFRQGAFILENALTGLTDIELDYIPKNGGWSIRQIIHHIVDGDDFWKTCIKMALGSEHAEFSLNWYAAMPQIEWAKNWNYEKRPIDISLNLLKAIRDHILQLLEYSPDGWNKPVQFRNPNGEIENVTVGFIIQMQANHVDHHVKRIMTIRKEISD